MNAGRANYFDNVNILKEFHHLFQLLPFKAQCKNHSFVCLVDNAKTHITNEFSINDFGMKSGIKCPINKLEFINEDNTKKIIKCHDDNGVSKWLLGLANELNIFVSRKCSRQELKLLLSKYVAFEKEKGFVFVN